MFVKSLLIFRIRPTDQPNTVPITSLAVVKNHHLKTASMRSIGPRLNDIAATSIQTRDTPDKNREETVLLPQTPQSSFPFPQYFCEASIPSFGRRMAHTCLSPSQFSLVQRPLLALYFFFSCIRSFLLSIRVACPAPRVSRSGLICAIPIILMPRLFV